MPSLTEMDIQAAPAVRPAAAGQTAVEAARLTKPWHTGAAAGQTDQDETLNAHPGLAWMPDHPRLARLARHISQMRSRGRPVSTRRPSGLAPLDAALGGGFATGAVHELVAGCEGAAVRTVALRTAAHAAGAHKWVFYIDTTEDLYPPALPALGVPLGRLMVVRASRVADALWVAEQTLRCQAAAAVVLPLRRLDARASRRLQLAAEAGRGLMFVLRGDVQGEPTFAASRLRFDPLPGLHGCRRLRVSVLKLRDGQPREPFVVELPDAADSESGSAVLVDRACMARRRASG